MLLVLLTLAACSSPIPTPAPVSTRSVNADNIVSAEAVIVPHKQTNLAFKTSGRVKTMLVTEGQAVTAGQELVRLDPRDLEQAFRQAEAAVKAAEAQLAKAKAGARPEEITAAEAAVAIAQAGVKAAEAAVGVAKGNLAAAQATLPGAQAAYQQLLDGPDADELAAAKASVEQARVLMDQAQQAYDRVKDQPYVGMTAEALQLQRATINYDTAQAQYRVVSRGARQAELVAAQAQVFGAQAAIETAQAQVGQAQAQLESAQAQVTQAQARLDLLKAGARPEDIAAAEAALTQSQAAQAAAANALDDATLTAPYGGTVAALLINEGDLTSPQVPAVRFGDLSRLQARTEDLSEVDIARVQVGQEGTVTVDALEGKVLKGRVAKIVPVASDRRGDKVYTVYLDLDAGPEVGLRWGMSALVEIKVR
jgi:multidrug resistance efflux pump